MGIQAKLSVLYFLWYASAVVRLAAVGRMAKNGLIRRYPIVAGALVFAAIRSTVLALYFRAPEYPLLIAVSEPFLRLLEGAAMVEVFWAVVEKYPKFRTPGLIFLSSVLGIAILATSGTQAWGAMSGRFAEWQAGGFALIVRRYSSLVMALVIGGVALLLPRVDGIPIRPGAARAAGIIAVHATANLLTATISIWTGPTWFSYFAPVCTGLLVAALWLFRMTPASDVCGDFVPPTFEEEQEYKAIMNLIGPGQSVSRYMSLRMASLLREHAEMQAREDNPNT